MDKQQKIEISSQAMKEAVESLRTLREAELQSQPKKMIEDTDGIQLQLSLHIASKRRNTPIVVKLPNSIFSIENGDNAILFVSDNDMTTKNHLRDVPVKGLEKVIALSKARKNLATYKLKRDLSKNYKVYLADESIIPMMPSIIGKKAMKMKKIPYPIKTKVSSSEKLAEFISSALSSTQICLFGPCNVIHIARFDHSDDEIVANLEVILNAINQHVPFLAVDSLILKSAQGKGIVLYKASGDVVVKVASMSVEEKEAYMSKKEGMVESEAHVEKEEKKTEEKTEEKKVKKEEVKGVKKEKKEKKTEVKKEKQVKKVKASKK